MRMWMAERGQQFKEPIGRPNYLGSSGEVEERGRHPFPANPFFKSEPVLSEKAREEIWRMIVKQGEAIKTVSATYGVDMRRVAAVVRLKEVEKAWVREVSFLFTYTFSAIRICPFHRLQHDET